MADDRLTLIAEISDRPEELTPYGALADLLDERGEPDLAYAYRWCMWRKRWPHRRLNYARKVRGVVVVGLRGRKVPEQFRWAWYGWNARTSVQMIFPAVDPVPHQLSPLMVPGEQVLYRSHQAALIDLANWLKKLRDAYTLEPRAAA